MEVLYRQCQIKNGPAPFLLVASLDSRGSAFSLVRFLFYRFAGIVIMVLFIFG